MNALHAAVHADMSLHAEVQLIAFGGLMHLRVALVEFDALIISSCLHRKARSCIKIHR
jgi:hypothetical protein